MPRRYEMTSRVASMQRTRESILDAAEELFHGAWFDEVTLADIARSAGVSQQTVVNHFGSKADLYLAGLRERFAPKVGAIREEVRPGDVASGVDAVLHEYEQFGDSTVRNLVLAERIPELALAIGAGREFHAEFVGRVFGPRLQHLPVAERERSLRLLGVALDVRAWHQLRREQGLDLESTRADLEGLVDSLLP
jgi:AcrR family transcriptional regulator